MSSNLQSSANQFVSPEATLSVAGLTLYIQGLLEDDPQLQQVWVTGEVSSASRYRSGLFFTLQDPDQKAAISCVIWNNQIGRLATVPVPGEQFIILGRVHVHRKRGTYQLIVWQALPAGEGLRAIRYRQLRKRLEAEGLFASERKRPLPLYPRTIAVVTSPQAAAWGDIQRTLRRRYPGLHVLFSPALVQGDQAPMSISRAVARVVRDQRAEMLILSRGGGATEDMDCFNDERVVRAIALCPIPVVAGIGHQRDESLADLVADVCAHTPTAAAEQSIPRLADLYSEHQDRARALRHALQHQLNTAYDVHARIRERLRRLQLDQHIRQETQSVDWLRQRLIQTITREMRQATQQCQLLHQKLDTLNPDAVLRRGYALVRQTDNGAIARSASDLTPGQELHIQLAQGQLNVTVSRILDTSPDPSSSPNL
ncbi:MAG: exodeoxyribonuclease VII large subunit [Elainellaceae cyanobacterium]